MSRQLFWICELKVDGPIWQIIRQTRLLGAVSGERKKVLTLGLTDKGKLDRVIKSSETDAAHQTKRRHRIKSLKSFPGAYDVMEPLRSIPNSVVKRCYGEDTRRVTAR